MEGLKKPEEMCAYLGVSLRTSGEMARDGRVPSLKLGHRTRRFDLAEVKKAIRHTQEGIVSEENPNT